MEFEKGKKYVFDKEIWKKRHPGYAYAYEQAKEKNNAYIPWVDALDGETVNVEDSFNGTIDLDGFKYRMAPNWCKEIKG